MKKILLYILIVIALTPAFSHAQEYKLLEPLPCIPDAGQNCTDNKPVVDLNLNSFVGYVFKFSIALAAFLAVIMIIWGGFQIMLSESPFSIGEGKKKIWDAIIGLVMVLSSYLILETIDPRLVQIKTAIPPIEVDKSGLEDFQKSFVKDLSNLNAENQIKFQDLSQKQIELEKKSSNLKARWLRGEITDSEYEIENVKINQEISGIKTEKTQTIAEDRGISYYKTAYNLLYSTQSVDRNGLTQYTVNTRPKDDPMKYRRLSNGQYPTNSNNVILDQYNEQLNNLLKINPRTEDIANSIPILVKQRDFYVDQVAEEVKLYDLVSTQNKTATDGRNGQLVTYTIDHTAELNIKKAEYIANLNDSTKAKEIGISPDQYKTIMQNRIDIINKVIN